MCRHLAWLGDPRAVADFVITPEHSQLRQCYAARQLLRGSVCADGFGVGWFDPVSGAPARYRRAAPIWADTDLPGVAEVVSAGALVAAVRNGTSGIPGGVASTQPVLTDGLLATHNGYVEAFARYAPRPVGARLADGQLCDTLYVRRGADGTIVASEPLDGDAGRTALPGCAVTEVTVSAAVVTDA
jgi:predicted glutamine amidotransferase